MTKKMQMISIDMENYLQALNSNLIKDKKLSGMLNDFLTNYFLAEEQFGDLFLKKEKIIQEIKDLKEILIKKAGELVLIEIQIDKERNQENKENKEEFKEVEKMQKVIKDSGILDEVL